MENEGYSHPRSLRYPRRDTRSEVATSAAPQTVPFRLHQPGEWTDACIPLLAMVWGKVG